jgi:hypothetical protein
VGVDTESWTFSIEVLSQKLVVIPPDEDPIPAEGDLLTPCQMLVFLLAS